MATCEKQKTRQNDSLIYKIKFKIKIAYISAKTNQAKQFHKFKLDRKTVKLNNKKKIKLTEHPSSFSS